MSQFVENETVILTDKAAKGLPMRVGSLAKIINILHTSVNYDYDVQFSDGEIAPVRECELNKLTDEIEQYMIFIFKGNKVLYWFDTVTIQKVDYLHKIAEIEFGDKSSLVVEFDKLKPIEQQPEQVKNENYFEQKGLEIGKLVNKKQVAYGDSISKAYKLMQVYLENYDNGNDTYTIPKSLLKHILLQIRIIDKQNRIFNNPDGDLMEENSYADTVGYGLLGMRMIDEQND
jgi:hypothetical protein